MYDEAKKFLKIDHIFEINLRAIRKVKEKNSSPKWYFNLSIHALNFKQITINILKWIT